MNENYFPNTSFPGKYQSQNRQNPTNSSISQEPNYFSNNYNIPPTSGEDIDYEQSYIENILRLNRGKLAKIYATFPDATEWRDKVFTGIIEAAGRDHLVMSDPQTGKWYLIKMIYFDYAEFDEAINYNKGIIPNT